MRTLTEPLGPKIPLLNAGHIQLIEAWGSDDRIVESARMSTRKGFEGWGPRPCDCVPSGHTFTRDIAESADPACKKCKGMGAVRGDEKLLRYLYENAHHTPFEMAGMMIEVQAPIFVFREWHRHRTQSYNEMSGRYTKLPQLCYLPTDERINTARQSKKNKQGSEEFNDGESRMVRVVVRTAFKETYGLAWTHYQEMLGRGVARELASRVLPVSQYSRMRASADLRCWLMFLTLRQGSSVEIRQYAEQVAMFVEAEFPRTYELFLERHHKGSEQ